MGDFSYCDFKIRKADLPLFTKHKETVFEKIQESHSNGSKDESISFGFEEVSGGGIDELTIFSNAGLTFIGYVDACAGVWHSSIFGSYFGKQFDIETTDTFDFFLKTDDYGHPINDPELKKSLAIYRKAKSYVTGEFRKSPREKAEVARQVLLGHART